MRLDTALFSFEGTNLIGERPSTTLRQAQGENERGEVVRSATRQVKQVPRDL
jgi:hypothetical protein